MAAALLAHRARGKVGVRSAGSPPAESLNPAAVQVLAELGIVVAARTPSDSTIGWSGLGRAAPGV